MTKEVYVFGYGSLINEDSRKKNMSNDNEYIYGKINSYKRSWCINILNRGLTTLGLFREEGSYCNGIYIKVSYDDLKSLDEREIKGSNSKYERVLLDSNECEKFFEDKIVYTYITKDIENPSKSYPIVQSYLDVVMVGCLRVSKGFAEEFILSTSNWDFIYNDREEPLYKHPQIISKYYYEIDMLIKSKIN